MAGWLRNVSLAVLGLLVALLLHRGVLDVGFYADDWVLLQRCIERSLGDVIAGDLFGDFLGGEHSVAYWRPGWYLLWEIVHTCAGEDPVFYHAVCLLLHGAMAAGVALVARAFGMGFSGALLAMLAFAAAPTAEESLAWISAGLNVLPAALALLVAGLLLFRFLADGCGRALMLCSVAALVSLTFKEAAYYLPVLALGGGLLLGQTGAARRAWLAALPLAVLTAVHYVWFNSIDSGGRALGLLGTNVFDAVVHGTRDLGIVPDALGDGFVMALIVIALLGAAVGGGARGRYFVIWTLAALLPYALVADEERFRYFWLAPAALAAGNLIDMRTSAVGVWPQRFRWPLLGLGMAALVAMVVAIPAAVAPHRVLGQQCTRVEAQVRKLDTREQLFVDRVPLALRHGLHSMLRLLPPSPVDLRELFMFPRPPFAIYMDLDFPALSDDAEIWRWEPVYDDQKEEISGDYQVTTKAALLGKAISLPILAAVGRWRVVDDEDRTLEMLRDGEVDPAREAIITAPLPFASVPGAPPPSLGNLRAPTLRDMRIEIEAAAPALLVIAYPPGRITELGGVVTIDGEMAQPITAQAFFDAVPVPVGSHVIVVRLP